MADHYPVVTSVAMSDIENLRAKAQAATERFSTTSRTWVEVRSEGVVFWFENGDAALLFTLHCARNGISFRRTIEIQQRAI
jgi:hypothetical protein